MSAPTGRSQSAQNSYYDDRRISPLKQQRYVEQGYEEYGSQLTSSPGPDVDGAIARMGNMRINDDRQMLPPPRSSSTPVTSSGLRAPFTQQRSTSPRPRPNTQEHLPSAPQYQRQQEQAPQYPRYQEQMPTNSQYSYQDPMPPASQYSSQEKISSNSQYSHQEQTSPVSQYSHQERLPPPSQHSHQEKMPLLQRSLQERAPSPSPSQYSYQEKIPQHPQYSEQVPPSRHPQHPQYSEQVPPSRHPQHPGPTSPPQNSQVQQEYAPPSQYPQQRAPPSQYPQHQEQAHYPQQQEYQDYGYQDDYYNNYPPQDADPSSGVINADARQHYYNQYENPEGRDYYAAGQNYDPATGYPEDYPHQQYAYDQGAYDYQQAGYGYDQYQQEYPPGEGYYGGEGPPQYYYDQQQYYDPNYDPNYYPPQAHPQDGYGAPMYYDQQQTGQSSLPMRTDSQNEKAKQESAPKEKPSYAPDAIEKYRARAKASGNPATLFAFAKYLVEAAAETEENDPDPKNAKKRKEALLQEAIKLVKRLAQGMGFGRPAYPEAQFYLANCYSNGSLGLPVDPDKAFNLYMQASKQNHAAATYRTSVCYEVGAGTKRDPHRATQFYKKAAALGDTAAMYKLGMIMLKGLLAQNPNPREAIIWLKRAAANADEENPHALHELGLLHAKPEKEPPEIPSLIRNEKHAIEEFKRAADLGYAPSCYKLGTCYEYGQLGCPVDPRQSIKYYSKAAEKGHPEAELALSGWYLTGSEVILKQSDAEAYLWARKAADKGFAKAEYAIGYYSEVGIGVKQDIEEARRWYMRSAAQGNKKSMQRLTELKKLGSQSRVKPAKHTRAQANKEDCVIS